MKYYSGSFLQIEWTAQHGCGTCGCGRGVSCAVRRVSRPAGSGGARAGGQLQVIMCSIEFHPHLHRPPLPLHLHPTSQASTTRG